MQVDFCENVQTYGVLFLITPKPILKQVGHKLIWTTPLDHPNMKPFCRGFHKTVTSIFKVNKIPLEFSTIFLGNYDHL